VAGTDGRANVAHVVGAELAELGVDTAFGLLGSGNLVVTNALCAGGAAFYPARHEAGAVSMADAWARVTGRVGVATVHQGPGLTNTLTALGEATKSRTPLLVLAGETPAAALRSNFRIDQHDLVAAVGAVPERVYSARTAAADAARALRRAELERIPVVLMLPIDLQAEWVPDDARHPEPGTPLPVRPAPSDSAVTEAARLLAGGSRPVILAGRGAVLANARPDLERLGDRLGALFAASAVAKGFFEGHPYDLGISGGFSSPFGAELLSRADVVVAFGATLNHWTTRHGALVADDATVIQVDVEADQIGAHFPVTLGIVGDAAATARALATELERLGPDRPGFRTPELIEQIASRRWGSEPFEDASTNEWIDPRTLTVALAEILPVDLTIAVDSGHFVGYPAEYLSVPDARSWVFPNAFQAVGLGLGCGIGAAIARPGRLTVAVLGDGGTFLALQELETAVRLSLRLLVVIYDDAAYGAEVHHFQPLGEDVSLARFPAADLAAVACALGAEAVTVRSTADLQPIANWIERGSGPFVVDAKTNPNVCDAWLEEAFRAG
jgi:thiamine pyrophosphate-dependent acetolactate synthase large subunit-like protein